MPPGPGLVHAQCPRRADGIARRTPHEVAYEPPTKTRPLTSAGGGGGVEAVGKDSERNSVAVVLLLSVCERRPPNCVARRYGTRGGFPNADWPHSHRWRTDPQENEDNSFLEPMLSLILDARLSAQNNAFGSSHSHGGPSEPRGLCGRSGRTTKSPTPEICFSPRNTHGTVSAYTCHQNREQMHGSPRPGSYATTAE